MDDGEDNLAARQITFGNILVPEEANPTAQEMEQYKAYWKRRGFPDVKGDARVERGHTVSTGLDYDDPSYQPIPERDLWECVLKEAIDDAKGVGMAAFHPCECGNRHATNQTCARIWLDSEDFIETCNLLGLEPKYVRKQAGV